MLSAIFVDRPRLAIVIAIVTTIAGFLALFSIPIAQYPDIVPPQVSVTTFYPGANSAVVDATVAQPIEAQVVGVDKMIYMKSVSGDDGSYTLTCSFELGTDPDINAVNVNNRVQVALSQLPQDVQQPGRHRQEEVFGPARRDRRLLAETYARPLVHLQLRHHQPARPRQEHAGRRRRVSVGPAGLRDAGLGPNRQADRAQSDDRRHHQCDPVTEYSGRRRAHRREADFGRSAATAQHSDQGPPELARGVRQHRRAHQSGWIRAAPRRCREAGTGRRQSGPGDAVQRRARGGDCGLPIAGRQCHRHPQGRARSLCRAGKAIPRRSRLEGHLRSDHVRHRYHPRGSEDAARGIRPRRHRGLSVPRATYGRP